MNKRKRLALGVGVACGLHLVIAGLLPGFLAFLPQPLKAKIIEVNIVDLESNSSGQIAAAALQSSVARQTKTAAAKTDTAEATNAAQSEYAISEPQSTYGQPAVSAPEAVSSAPSATGPATENSGSSATAEPTKRPGEGELANRPRLLSGGKNYPSAARSAGQQGTVLVRLNIDANGQVTSASLTGSSGYPLLDNAALNAVYSWSFSPATDPYGTPLAYSGTIPIEYSLQN